MKKLLIIADYNDADYVEHAVRVEDKVFEKFLPLMKAINEFEPYVCRSSFGSICNHNWISPREDLGEKNIYETYPQFSRESMLAAFDAGYKACIKETLNWLRQNGDNYVWIFEGDGGLADEIFDDLAHYLNHKLEINDL